MLALPTRPPGKRNNASKKRHVPPKNKAFGDHRTFINRVTKTLCYGEYPELDCTSLPVTELAAELFTCAKNKTFDVQDAALLSRRLSISPCSLVLALIYLDRLKATNPKYLAKIPPSELFVMSLMVGAKFSQDDGQEDEQSNKEWFNQCGLYWSVQDLNSAEKEFLDAIQWDVFVSSKAFWRKLESLEGMIALRQGVQRGWFSYTELDLLFKSSQLASLIKTIFNLSVMCMASYTASVLAVLGSTLLVTPTIQSLHTIRSPIASQIPPETTSLPQDPRLQDAEPDSVQNWNCCDLEDRLANGLEEWNKTNSICEINMIGNRSIGICEIDFLEIPWKIASAENNSAKLKWDTWAHSDGNHSWTKLLRDYLIDDIVTANIMPMSA